MIEYPKNQKVITNRYEKKVSRTFGKFLSDDYMVIHDVNISGIKGDVNMLLISTNGIVLFKFSNTSTYDFTTVKTFHEITRQNIIKKIKKNIWLNDAINNKSMSFKYIAVLSEIERTQIKVNDNDQYYIDNNFRYNNFHELINENIDHEIENLFDNQNKFLDSDDKVNTIISLFSPATTLIRLNVADVKRESSGLSSNDIYVKSRDRITSILRLDDDQIDYMNNMQSGHRLILACAGSGKSVLLLSKCFKAASLDSSKRYLITCYNRNLASFYQWQIDTAGFREYRQNVKCMTFHSFCNDLLTENNLPIPYDDDYNDGFEKVLLAVEKGIADKTITTSFYGIFIDEVQIFDTRWYKICYSLLENKGTDNNFFVICGDITQNINKDVKRGNASWQGDKNLPVFKGRTHRIEKNYRNCHEINQFINIFTNNIKKELDAFDADSNYYEDLFLRGKSVKSGNHPKLIEYDDMLNETEARKIIDSVKYMHDVDGIPYSEICVLLNIGYCYGVNGYVGFIRGKKGNREYAVLKRLETLFPSNEIPVDYLSWDNDKRIAYSARTGVSLMTYKGSLGLDYRGVIVAGLPTLAYHCHLRTYEDIENCEASKEEKIDNIIMQYNFLYLAFSRAKESLHIIAPSARFDSIYIDTLRRTMNDYLKEVGDVNDRV